MISARPPEIRSSVANCWNTRTGSSEESTLTALVSRMASCARRRRRAPRPARTRRSPARWCSPTPKTSSPTWSASAASSTTSRSRCAGPTPPGPGRRRRTCRHRAPRQRRPHPDDLAQRRVGQVGAGEGDPDPRQVGLVPEDQVHRLVAGRNLVLNACSDRNPYSGSRVLAEGVEQAVERGSRGLVAARARASGAPGQRDELRALGLERQAGRRDQELHDRPERRRARRRMTSSVQPRTSPSPPVHRQPGRDAVHLPVGVDRRARPARPGPAPRRRRRG